MIITEINKKILIHRGIVRQCSNCDFETSTRQEMRLHERQTGHTLDRSQQDEIKHYTAEEKYAKSKGKAQVKNVSTK